jgi:hypothetical protein
MRSVVLAIALIGVWLGVFINRRENARLESRLKTMLPLVRELVIEDPAKIAVVKLEEMWYDENHWDIWLPPGSYRVCVATRAIDDMGFPADFRTAMIAAGRHRVALEAQREKEQWRVVVTADRNELLAVEEPKEWDPGNGSSGGSAFAECMHLDPSKPLVLFRRRFSRGANGSYSTPSGPTEGILLWIERTGDAK